MTEIVVLDVPAEEDLQGFSKYLWGQAVSHRILEDQGRKLLLVGEKSIALQVRQAYEDFQAGAEQTPTINVPTGPAPREVFIKLIKHLPVTLVFIVLSIMGCGLVYLDPNFEWVKQLTFFDFKRAGSYVVFSVPDKQYWRLFTPVFLHFGIMHLAFNMALLWFVGHRIELLQGSYRMLGITLLIVLGSNVMQATYAEAGIFGGMSGVVYGLLGYGWVWSWLRPEKNLHIPNVILYFSLFMMVMGFAGLVGMLGAGKVANVAHLGGLIMGCLMGLGASAIDKLSSHE